MCGAYCTVHADPTFKVIDALGACTAVAILSNGKKMSLSSLQYPHEFAAKLITKHQHTLLLQTNDAFSTGPFKCVSLTSEIVLCMLPFYDADLY